MQKATTISLKIPDDELAALDRVARSRRLPRSEVVRVAVRREVQPFPGYDSAAARADLESRMRAVCATAFDPRRES